MRKTYRILYALGLLPWDSANVPEPLARFAAAAHAGVAVDLGCGTGAQARYLAGRGWAVTAVDYTPRAVELARRDDPQGTVTWRVADVTAPAEVDPTGELADRCDLILDNGCLHGIPAARRTGWASTVQRLAGPRATVLVRAAPPGGRLIGPHGMAEAQLAALLGKAWSTSRQSGGWYSCARQ
jgi:SAM-dependent methyltransferase